MGNVCGKKKSAIPTSKKTDWASTCYVPNAPGSFKTVPLLTSRPELLPKPDLYYTSPTVRSSISQKTIIGVSSSVNSPTPQSINSNALDKYTAGPARSVSITKCTTKSSNPEPISRRGSIALPPVQLPSPGITSISQRPNIKLSTNRDCSFISPPESVRSSITQKTILGVSSSDNSPRPQSINSNVLDKSTAGLARSVSIRCTTNSSNPAPIPVIFSLPAAKITSISQKPVPTPRKKFAPEPLKISVRLPSSAVTKQNVTKPVWLFISPSESVRSSITEKTIPSITSVKSSRSQSINRNALDKSTTCLTRSISTCTANSSTPAPIPVIMYTALPPAKISSYNPSKINTTICKPLILNSSLQSSWFENVIDNVRFKYDDANSLTFTNNHYVSDVNVKANQRIEQPKVFFAQYWPSRDMRALFNNNFKKLNTASTSASRLNQLNQELKSNSNPTEKNYLDMLWFFADTEDLYCEEAIRVYNRKSEKVDNFGKEFKYIIYVPNLIDSRPTISVCSRLTINSSQLNNKIYGTISDIQPDYIVVEFKKTIDLDIRYDVDFLSNRTTFRMEKLAIDLIRKKHLVPFMFPHKNKVRSSSVANTKQNFVWYNTSVANNQEQQTAIESIYNGTSYPYPYILFGPPGTGKTTTVVESILQLWKNKTDTQILVVSTSNFACNVISKRLLEFLPSTEIFRLFSKSQEVVVDKIDEHVLNVANFKNKKHYYPKPCELYSYRIIITTPTASGHLILDGFDCNHFTHLFVDECASCTEGSTLIPIAGLISSHNTIKANIVLAGDPLQLSPVIHSKYANDLGYSVSMIERLMSFSLYKPDEETGDYNNNFITKLRLNYRSHKHIIHISNQLFYNNELKALGPSGITDWIINWRYLPNPKFPIMFEACFGESISDNDSPSLYNKHEIKVVISYLQLLVNKTINGKKVKQSDIGVITPYRKQNQKIRAQFGGRWNEVEVASVEAFQGNEKSIIILSTVRSNVDSMGFLSNERRLNVALTRAQGMLIIIGDPKVLMRDKCWYQLMKFCYDNNAICGEPFNFYD